MWNKFKQIGMEKKTKRKKWFVEMDFILFVQHPKINISLLVLLS